MVSNLLRILLLLMLVSQVITPQSSKIIKILNTNLFQLEDGRKVRLAGIEMPPIEMPGSNMQKHINRILRYEDNTVFKRKLNFIFDGYDPGDSAVHLVYMLQPYDLEDIDINELFLLYGFGRFINNIDSIHYEKYIKAEKKAQDRSTGLWAFRPLDDRDTLDRKYSLNETEFITRLDSLYQVEALRRTAPPLAAQYAWQTASGILVGGITSLAGGIAGIYLVPSKRDFGPLFSGLFGMSAGYLVGVPLGVYLAAKGNNPALSYLPILGFSTLSAAAGLGIVYLGPKDHNPLWIAPFIMPIVGSLIYVNAIAPNPVRENIQKVSEEFQAESPSAFKNHFDQTTILRLNLLKISL